ncbi:hypothetical protein FZ025_16190 [Xanthomonas hyacinthi]|uniref:Uncharacterized protein n=2 Tax=Xanthomonas hyacinthi TaxID=56455 RepID=A0A2S7ERI1_9XANT|nr:hypothetical protein XhyaCFBP1156_18060 [Xanthomonas hyacinthi]QGY78096.1 hypothetical protein FZ025_16190 [Xanthomonas hyacinthi]
MPQSTHAICGIASLVMMREATKFLAGLRMHYDTIPGGWPPRGTLEVALPAKAIVMLKLQ